MSNKKSGNRALLAVLITLLLLMPFLAAGLGCDDEDDEGNSIGCFDIDDSDGGTSFIEEVFGCDEDGSYENAYYNQPNTIYAPYNDTNTTVVDTNVAPGGGSATEYLTLFFNDPTNPKLLFFVPEYTYLQGLVYCRGEIKTMGPIRIMGGIIGNKDTSGNAKPITLKCGAMLTTIPDYLERKTLPPKNRYKIVTWKEISSESVRGQQTP